MGRTGPCPAHATDGIKFYRGLVLDMWWLMSTDNEFLNILRSPRIDFKESRNNSASLCSLAGRYDNPIPTQFLAPMDSLKIPAQDCSGTNFLVA